MSDLPSFTEGSLLTTLIGIAGAVGGAVVTVFTFGRKTGASETDLKTVQDSTELAHRRIDKLRDDLTKNIDDSKVAMNVRVDGAHREIETVRREHALEIKEINSRITEILTTIARDHPTRKDHRELREDMGKRFDNITSQLGAVLQQLGRLSAK